MTYKKLIQYSIAAKTNIIFFALFLSACNQRESVNESKNTLKNTDSISYYFDNTTFNNKETFLRHPDGKEDEFRKLFLSNNSKQSLYINLLEDKSKFVYDRVNAHYDKTNNKWVENKSWSCGFNIYGYYEIKPSITDTIIVSDPFRQFDGINYGIKYYLDTTNKNEVYLEKYFSIPKTEK
jgi:hypothetical protein